MTRRRTSRTRSSARDSGSVPASSPPPSRTAEQIFGPLDAMKLRSSMTLFHRAAPAEPVFRDVLDVFFDGIPDPATDAGLEAARR